MRPTLLSHSDDADYTNKIQDIFSVVLISLGMLLFILFHKSNEFRKKFGE